MKYDIKNKVFRRNRSDLKHVIVPHGVVEIADLAFSYCDQLYGVTIPNTVTAIGCNAFKKCENLRRVLLPEGVTVIGPQAFSQCVSLSRVSFPSTLKSVGGQAFLSCKSLASVDFSHTTVCFAVAVFSGCINLTKVTLPSLMTEISHNLFYNCKRLSTLQLPKTITSIQYRAFFACERLETLTLPSSVTEIGDLAFNGCTNLRYINVPAGVTSVNVNAFESCSKLKVIQVNSDSEIARVRVMLPAPLRLRVTSYYLQHQLNLRRIRHLQMVSCMPCVPVRGLNSDVQRVIFSYLSMGDLLTLAQGCHWLKAIRLIHDEIASQTYQGVVPVDFKSARANEQELQGVGLLNKVYKSRTYGRDLILFRKKIQDAKVVSFFREAIRLKNNGQHVRKKRKRIILI